MNASIFNNDAFDFYPLTYHQQFILYINPNTVRINRFILTVTYGYPYYKLIYGKDNFIYPKDKSLRTAEQ